MIDKIFTPEEPQSIKIGSEYMTFKLLQVDEYPATDRVTYGAVIRVSFRGVFYVVKFETNPANHEVKATYPDKLGDLFREYGRDALEKARADLARRFMLHIGSAAALHCTSEMLMDDYF